MEEITQKLKKFRNIVPDADYVNKSRLLIFSVRKTISPQEKFFGYLRFVFAESQLAAVALAFAVILVIFAFYGYFGGSEIKQANVGDDGLKLAETQYYQKSAADASLFSRFQETLGDFLANIF